MVIKRILFIPFDLTACRVSVGAIAGRDLIISVGSEGF